MAKKVAKKPGSKKKKAAARGVAARVRMYRTGLGDCFLLTFPRAKGKPFHMLIDCGVFFQSPNEKQILRDVATDIGAATDGTLDVLVGTHEHYDHLIGFKHAKDIFEKMTIREVWLSWCDKPGDPRAAWLRAIQNKLQMGLQIAVQRALDDPALAPRARKLQSLLEFEGNPLGADYSKQIGDVKAWLRDSVASSVRFLEPHRSPIELVPGVRVYPLGPPLKKAFFLRMNDSKTDPQTYDTAFAFAAVPAFLSHAMAGDDREAAEAETLAQPFERRWQVDEQQAKGEAFFGAHYGFDPKAADVWRRLDNNWLAGAESLALQLDSLTNNSSLAMAIEVGSARRVILMAADAQVGNWMSWHEGEWTIKNGSGADETVSAEDLLGRTVLYKVGHHGSHNATLRQRGLEMMTSDELVAMIPVNQKFANDTKGWQMPFPGLMKDLKRRTKGRIMRADTGLPGKTSVHADASKAFFAASHETPLYVEHLIPM